MARVLRVVQGKGKSTLEVLKRIDYGGIFTLLFAVRLIILVVKGDSTLHQVGGCLVFLSTRYNALLPVMSLYLPGESVLNAILVVVGSHCLRTLHLHDRVRTRIHFHGDLRCAGADACAIPP